MIDAALKADTQDIVIDEVFPHSPAAIWKAITTGELMARWLMEPSGFRPVEGNAFTYQTSPAGPWDGVIHCQVLEVVPNERFAYSWRGGDDSNVGYGSRLDTVVTFTLTPAPGGTRVRIVHSGFVLPRNASALERMTTGWQGVVKSIGAIAAELG